MWVAVYTNETIIFVCYLLLGSVMFNVAPCDDYEFSFAIGTLSVEQLEQLFLDRTPYFWLKGLTRAIAEGPQHSTSLGCGTVFPVPILICIGYR